MLQVGFDVGGTNIAVGVVDDAYQIVARRSVRFPTGAPYEDTVAQMAEMVREMAAELQVDCEAFQSIGIAVPGSIDRSRENVLHAYNLQFHDVPLRGCMQAHFPSVPVYLANDADTAALAELHAGAFVGKRTAVLITLGTGIGGGLILNGNLFFGGMGNGVELGHMVLQHGGQLCTCGIKGCIEALCNAVFLQQQGRRAVIDYPTTRLYTETNGDINQVTAKLVIDCAKAGDVIATDIFERYVDQLGSVVVSCIHLLDPETIAIGGGVSHAGEFLLAPIRENVRKKCFYDQFGDIVPATLGNDAGIIGAALLAKSGNARSNV